MYRGQIAEISNRADWNGPFVQLTDDDDGSIINILNTDIAFDCVVSIGEESCHYPRISASIADGGVVATTGDTGPGFQWKFTADSLKCLRAGTYQFGVKIQASGEVEDLILGTVVVIEGSNGIFS
jgi:hypothetical protein